MGNMYLVAGGCRSGKSSFASSQAMIFSKRYYLATGQAFDQEMTQRIALHRKERGEDFITLEEPVDIAKTLSAISGSGCIVIDCLTLWISNMLLKDFSDDKILNSVDQLVDQLLSSELTSYLVSNEVGMGIVPADALSRRFRDLAGWCHQRIASKAEEVYQMSFGIPLPLKKISHEFLPR